MTTTSEPVDMSGLLQVLVLSTAPDRPPVEGMQQVLQAVAGRLPVPAHASVTQRRSGQRPRTLVASGDVARTLDHAQYRADEGPCLQALATGSPVVVDDLESDPVFPGFRRQALGATAVRAVASLPVGAAEGARASLNVYVEATGRLGSAAVGELQQVAAASSLALLALEERLRAEHLEAALDSNRDIGVAMGVLMGASRITAEQAFAALRQASQNTNRKLRDVADDVIHTGVLPEPRGGRAS